MKGEIRIRLAVEDTLSEAIVRRVLSERPRRYEVVAVHMRNGCGYLKKQARSFNQAAKLTPFLLLTDLDCRPCPRDLIDAWLGSTPRHPQFLLRVAVREVESWLLGDREGLRRLLGLRGPLDIDSPERLPDPKMTLLGFATRASSRIRREALVHCDHSGRMSQGPDYNGTLGEFARESWDLASAQNKCPSLNRLVLALKRLEQSYSTGVAPVS